jgi:hypothetical protein
VISAGNEPAGDDDDGSTAADERLRARSSQRLLQDDVLGVTDTLDIPADDLGDILDLDDADLDPGVDPDDDSLGEGRGE